jgi:hypothetical protein
MIFGFTDENIKEISQALGAEPKEHEQTWSWHLTNPTTGHSLVLTIYSNVMLGKEAAGCLVTAQTQQGYYELHDCNGFMTFEPDETIFIKSDETTLASLIVGKQCTCSMYSNIRREILSADFAALDPAVLMSAMQLSLTESILI